MTMIFNTEMIDNYLIDIMKDVKKTSATWAAQFLKYLASLVGPYIWDIYEAISNYLYGKIEYVTINSLKCSAKWLLHRANKLGCSAFEYSKFLCYSCCNLVKKSFNGFKNISEDFALFVRIYEKVNETKDMSPIFYDSDAIQKKLDFTKRVRDPKLEFTKRSVIILKKWMHTKKRATLKERINLANRTRMDIDRITHWITNARQNKRRLRKRQNKAMTKKIAKTRKGNSFLPIQTAILKEFFAKKSYPDLNDIEDIKILIDETSTSDKRIKRWFIYERSYAVKKLKK